MHKMGTIKIDVICKNDVLVELDGDTCKVWKTYGLPDHRCLIDELETLEPEIFTELLERKLIKLKSGLTAPPRMS